jgi:hypothetical protein
MALSQSGDWPTLARRFDSCRLFGTDGSAIGTWKNRIPLVPPHVPCVAGRNRSARGRAAEAHATRAHFHHDGPVWQCIDGIQDELRLTPLSQFGKSDKQLPPDVAFSDERVKIENPQNVPDDLLFYVELAQSLKFTPPKARDVVVADSLADIGFKDHNTTFDYNSLNAA